MVFSNRAELGSFGEFVYQRFVKTLGLEITKEAILESDFLVDGKFYVDVKTTQNHKTKYTGLRVRKDISYDLVVVHDEKVRLFPDVSSPVYGQSGVLLGDLAKLVQEWRSAGSSISKNGIDNPHKRNRLHIKESILNQFSSANRRNVRVVFRGAVSQTRWSSSPDNVPGNSRTIAKYDLTIFVQMITSESSEAINKIYVFPHDLFPKVKMNSPDKRQERKGIIEVVDFESYMQNHNNLIFDNLNDLKVWIKCILV
jgi:hypothetical protein